MAATSKSVVVLGSLNMDIIASVERLPGAGETIAAKGLIRRFGGKGANQALAARKQGTAVAMIGCVGEDADGAAYRARFEKAGIEMQHVRAVKTQPTGTALIAVDARAENQIIVAAGANGAVSPAMVRAAQSAIKSASALLVQLEVPVPAVVAAMKIANREGVPVVFNPSPFRKDFPWGEVEIDFVIVNETEARQVFCRQVLDLQHSPKKWRTAMQQRRIENLVVTRGPDSTWLLNKEGVFEIPAFRVRPIDTVGAGDAFAGTLTACLAEGASPLDAIGFGNAAGALATSKSGAQEAMATAQAIRLLLKPDLAQTK